MLQHNPNQGKGLRRVTGCFLERVVREGFPEEKKLQQMSLELTESRRLSGKYVEKVPSGGKSKQGLETDLKTSRRLVSVEGEASERR